MTAQQIRSNSKLDSEDTLNLEEGETLMGHSSNETRSETETTVPEGKEHLPLAEVTNIEVM